jgi:2-polyprenyl-3-methyl-5-hydroxy-6-metoxy-1,4-benzoquinol methylase
VDLIEFLNLGDQPHGDSYLETEHLKYEEPIYPLRANICQSCYTTQIDFTVPKEVMFSHYLYVSGTTKTLVKHFSDSAERLVQTYKLNKEHLVVDIGSNDGTWLEQFRLNGVRVLGVDPAKNLAEYANLRGIRTLPEFFSKETARKVSQEFGKANLITAAGVFFHLEELHSVTEGIADLLSDGGVFCIQAIYLCDIIDQNKFDQIYHEHLTYWNLTTLKYLLKLHGLEPVFVRKIDIHGGSIEVHAAKQNERKIDPGINKMLQEEADSGHLSIEKYLEFSKRVWEIGERLKGILMRYKQQNKKIFALGAPIKGATLLNSFKIGSDLIDCAVEINPLKIGKFIPGCRIPIVDESKVSKPDVYLVLAWNFLDELTVKYSEFIRSGGELLIPVPFPKVIGFKDLVDKGAA